MKKLLAVLALAGMLSACITPLSHYQLSALNRGMSPSQVLARTDIVPLVSAPVSTDGRSFVFDRYLLSNGMNTDVYFLMYERGQLVFWGYINEFRRHPDVVLGRAVDIAVTVPVPKRNP